MSVEEQAEKRLKFLIKRTYVKALKYNKKIAVWVSKDGKFYNFNFGKSDFQQP